MTTRDSVRDAHAGSGGPNAPADPWLYWWVATILGVLNTWLLIGWREINPLNLSWLAGDPAQAEVGWEFLRHEHVWRFPPTMLTRLDYPSGVSASNLDIIPLIGVLLRPVSSFLPENFQYLGLYAVLCYVLQAYYGFRLTSIFSSDRIVTLLGGLFFLLSPILTIRLYGHFPHSSHWILLACIYHYFRPPSAGRGVARYMAPFLALCAIAAAITPYIAFMANLLAFSALFRAHLEERRRGKTIVDKPDSAQATEPRSSSPYPRAPRSYAFWIVTVPAITLASLTVFGFVTIGSFAGGGYTDYSMNILSPVDAHEGALILKHIPLIDSRQAYEGYNYLGIGVLLLLIIVLARKPELLRELWSPSLRPLVIVSAVFTVLALSLKVTFADHVLFTVPAPEFVFKALAALRSSGRLFWPVHYLIVVAAIAGIVISIRSATWQRVVLSAALLLQYSDVFAVRNGVAIAAQEPHSNPLVAADWKLLVKRHRHLVILPPLQCNQPSPGGLTAWPYFARLVARSDLTLNSAYLGRIGPKTVKMDCTVLPRMVLQNGLRPDTAYVLSDAFALKVLQKAVLSHYCRRVDGFVLCTYDPGRARESARLADVISPYELGTEFRSQEPTPQWLRLENFDEAPGWGRWAMGSTAAAYFRLANLLPGDLQLDIDVINANLSKVHQRQRAILSLNGHAIGMLMFRFPNGTGHRTLEIAARYVQPGLNVLRFELPDAISPRELGINSDPRPLSLYLHALKLSAPSAPSKASH
ncbi:MAG TPA: DUF6311 domain-containing protein [Rhizomicrobium sp.]|nr:DUF6311 domain-containing protein [Rhizomicrobium sp.]